MRGSSTSYSILSFGPLGRGCLLAISGDRRPVCAGQRDLPGVAELVFQVLSERHERGSLIVATNLPFGEWTQDLQRPPSRESRRRGLTHPRAHGWHRHRRPGASVTASPARQSRPPDLRGPGASARALSPLRVALRGRLRDAHRDDKGSTFDRPRHLARNPRGTAQMRGWARRRTAVPRCNDPGTASVRPLRHHKIPVRGSGSSTEVITMDQSDQDAGCTSSAPRNGFRRCRDCFDLLEHLPANLGFPVAGEQGWSSLSERFVLRQPDDTAFAAIRSVVAQNLHNLLVVRQVKTAECRAGTWKNRPSRRDLRLPSEPK